MRARIALIVGFAMLGVACDGLCANEIVSDVPSPSGRSHAVVFTRDCGATTGVAVQVSVLVATKHLSNEPGNAFIAVGGHAGVPLDVAAAWESERTLRLIYDARLRTFRKEPAVGDVHVRYSGRPRR